MNISEFTKYINIFNIQTNKPVLGGATLVAGTVTVAFPSITATSRIFVTPQSGTANAGAVAISARTDGTSFVITSTNALDAREVAYQIYV